MKKAEALRDDFSNVILAVFCMFLALPRIALAEDLRIASWNLEFFSTAPYASFDGKGGSRGVQEIRKYFDIIGDLSPDIMFVQELHGSRTANELAEGSGLTVAASAFISNEELYSAILYRESDDLVKISDFNSRLGLSNADRGFPIARFVISSLHFSAIGVHMKSGCGVGDPSISRNSNCKSWLRMANSLKNAIELEQTVSEVVVVSGDFNFVFFGDKILSDYREYKRDSVLEKIFPYSSKYLDIILPTHTKEMCSGRIAAKPTSIDYIFMRSSSRKASLERYFQRDYSAEERSFGYHLSNHCPIFAILNIS